ncbi:putative signal transducing protein [Psychroflexus sp. ALD_RP9]|uniref:putative signal transducing protein n=1 Tax=Psychroflexus sp. ALD_RP9 TaxID=2777186 RepID=UPI001A909443|nr:DUF2007 domain-containing protein [Psychroflexus sp. ALD_RP9]QSS98083.1 DUF2007 domain-containing protein [Psychroflexus sp. ALD_RP9]
MINYVKIATFTYAYEYSVIQHLLEQENIRYVFQNETALGVMPFYANALGGIFLKVHPDDVLEAKEILERFKSMSNLDIVD